MGGLLGFYIAGLITVPVVVGWGLRMLVLRGLRGPSPRRRRG